MLNLIDDRIFKAGIISFQLKWVFLSLFSLTIFRLVIVLKEKEATNLPDEDNIEFKANTSRVENPCVQ